MTQSQYIFTWADGGYSDPISLSVAKELLLQFPDGSYSEIGPIPSQFDEYRALEALVP